MWSHPNGAYTRVPAGIIEEKLKPAIYMLNYNEMGGFYFLTNVLDFTVPSELYGTIKADVDRIFATYNSREASSGIMLSGVMGSGKTLMAKLISHKALEYGMPTIKKEQTGVLRESHLNIRAKLAYNNIEIINSVIIFNRRNICNSSTN